MRKFILMLSLSLGGIVSAQSFDFSCSTITAEEMTAQSNTDFDIFQDPLFVEDQMTTLEVAGFNQGRQGFREDGVIVYYNDINHYAMNIVTDLGQHARVSIDVVSAELYLVNASAPNFAVIDEEFMTFATAMDYVALQLRRILDTDGNGFIPVEEEMLSDASFVPQSGTLVFSRDYANTDNGDGTFIYTPVWIHAVDGGFQAQGEDGFPDTTRDTLAELIAFLDAFDFYSL